MDTFLVAAQAAHRQTNCVTHFIPSSSSSSSNSGFAVSIKDTIDISGLPSTIGFSSSSSGPVNVDSAIVRLLRDAGAYFIAKTTVPTALMALHTHSDSFGHTTHPKNSQFTTGASTGGGAALLALGGSKIDVGSDIGGSIRIPAHFCGLYSLKGSVGRFPAAPPSSFIPSSTPGPSYILGGNRTPMPGFDSIQTVCGPMARSLHDLSQFYQRVVNMQPCKYDYSCIPLPWRPAPEVSSRPLRWGIIWDDGIIPLSPACLRALSLTANALQAAGHQIVTFSPPSIPDGLAVANQLAFEDRGAQIRDHLLPGERVSLGLQQVFDILDAATSKRSFRSTLAGVARAFKTLWTKTLGKFFRSSPSPSPPIHTPQQAAILAHRALIVKRDAYRAAWHAAWADAGIDFVLSAVHPLPAYPIYGEDAVENEPKVGLGSVGLTFIFNLLDYTAGVVPVSSVDPKLDAYPPDFLTASPPPPSPPSSSPPHPLTPPAPYPYTALAALPPAAHSAHSVYFATGATRMDGMPLGVQVVGRRLEEERVLAAMGVLESAVRGDASVITAGPVGDEGLALGKARPALAKGHKRARSTGHVML